MAVSDADTHHQVVDITNPERRPAILMVVANPGVSTTLGWPVGFWAAELFHPQYSGRKVAELVIEALGD